MVELYGPSMVQHADTHHQETQKEAEGVQKPKFNIRTKDPTVQANL